MTNPGITLESFDVGPAEPRRESADYERGVRAGIAQAEASLSAQKTQAAQDIAASLNDMTFGYAEARQYLLDRFAPIIAQLSEAILPEVLKQTFAAHLTDLITSALEDAADMPLTVRLPTSAGDIRDEVEAMVSPAFSITLDPGLAEGQAEILHGETQLFLDLAAFLNDLQTALRGVDETERSLSHG